jgi:hypothetical protein
MNTYAGNGLFFKSGFKGTSKKCRWNFARTLLKKS